MNHFSRLYIFFCIQEELLLPVRTLKLVKDPRTLMKMRDQLLPHLKRPNGGVSAVLRMRSVWLAKDGTNIHILGSSQVFFNEDNIPSFGFICIDGARVIASDDEVIGEDGALDVYPSSPPLPRHNTRTTNHHTRLVPFSPPLQQPATNIPSSSRQFPTPHQHHHHQRFSQDTRRKANPPHPLPVSSFHHPQQPTHSWSDHPQPTLMHQNTQPHPPRNWPEENKTLVQQL